MGARTTFMSLAMDQARIAASLGETPVGAVVTNADGTVLAVAHNLVISRRDPTAHAEMLAIREACTKLRTERLPECDVYVTLEPCTMCAAAISFARIRRLYFGASDEKGGAVENGVRFYSSATCHHRPDVYSGIAATEASSLLTNFFKMRRD